jgi:DNA-binding NarL/FixJ family response regulator
MPRVYQTVSPWNLSLREAETLDLYCETGSMKVVADKMGLSFRTVEAHLSSASMKIGARSGVRKVVIWTRYRCGLDPNGKPPALQPNAEGV